jgi:uncharacterized membrane protein
MRKWYPWLLVGLAFGFSAAMYSKLPAEIPSHWGTSGEVNGWMPRVWGVWLMPVVLLAMAVVLPRLPQIDPRRDNYDKFRPSYDLVVDAVMTLLAVLHGAMLGAGAGWPVRMERIAPVLVGVMFVVIGNVMPRARPNWLFGIRTPWTLTNDRVWERTHRIGGMLFVAAGILLAVAAFAAPATFIPVMIVSVATAAVVPVVYSYFAWRQEIDNARNS